MLDKTELVKVTNRSEGGLCYQIPDLDLRREYYPNETKEVTVEEMRKLSYVPGGKYMIDKYLVIQNEELVNELLGKVEPEYFYTEKDIVNLLLNGSYDQLDDCLTFGGTGVVEVVQQKAVELEINDVTKRELILKKTGFDVNNAILINHQTEEDEQPAEPKSTRKAAPITATTQAEPARKAAAPKYKVTSIDK